MGSLRYQPQGRVWIDRSNPLGAKVIECLPLNGQMLTAVSRKPITPGPGASTAASPRGYSLRGSGSASRASVPLDLSKYSKITVAFWLYWDAYANNDALAMEFGATYASVPGFIVDPNCSSPAAFMFGVGASAVNGSNLAVFPRPSAGVWHRIALTMDRSASAGAAGLAYVDGVQQVISAFPGATTVPPGNFTADTLHLFSRNDASLFGTGNLEAVTFYDGILSAQEAAEDARNPYQIFVAPEEDDFVSAAGSNASARPQGVAGLASVGSVTVSAGARAVPAGVAATATVGTVLASAGTSASASPAGVSASAAVGVATAAAGARAVPAGAGALAQVGAVTATGGSASTAAPAGVSVAASVGLSAASGSASVAPQGVAASASVGLATASAGINGTANPVGVGAAPAVGTAAGSGSARCAPGGVAALTSIGAVIAAGNIVVPGTAFPLGVTAYARVGAAAATGGGMFARAPAGPGYTSHQHYNESRPAATQRNNR